MENIDQWHDLTQIQWAASLELDMGTSAGGVFSGSFRDSIPGFQRGEVFELVLVQPLGFQCISEAATDEAYEIAFDIETTVVFQRGISRQTSGFNVGNDPDGIFANGATGATMTSDIDAVHRGILHYTSHQEDTTNATGSGGTSVWNGPLEIIDFRDHFGHGPLIDEQDTEVQTTVRTNGGVGAHAEGTHVVQYGYNLYFDKWEQGEIPVTNIEG